MAAATRHSTSASARTIRSRSTPSTAAWLRCVPCGSAAPVDKATGLPSRFGMKQAPDGPGRTLPAATAGLRLRRIAPRVAQSRPRRCARPTFAEVSRFAQPRPRDYRHRSRMDLSRKTPQHSKRGPSRTGGPSGAGGQSTDAGGALPSQRVVYLGVCIGLAALVWIVFGQTFTHQFINYDDPLYVLSNPHINQGLSWAGVKWAFTHVHSQNWHPLTSISHMIDCQVFGVAAGWHHLVNVLLHSVAAVLLFWFLSRSTGVPQRICRSGFRYSPAAGRIGGVDRRTQRCAEWHVLHAHAGRLWRLRAPPIS